MLHDAFILSKSETRFKTYNTVFHSSTSQTIPFHICFQNQNSINHLHKSTVFIYYLKAFIQSVEQVKYQTPGVGFMVKITEEIKNNMFSQSYKFKLVYLTFYLCPTSKIVVTTTMVSMPAVS